MITIKRLREVVEFFNEDTEVTYKMWYDGFIDTIFFARITTPPLNVAVFWLQDSIDCLGAIEKVAKEYLAAGESEESAILNAIFTVATEIEDNNEVS